MLERRSARGTHRVDLRRGILKTAERRGPESGMTNSLFICYSHADSAQVVKHLSWLREDGFDPWFDEHITGGSVWRDAISDAIEASAALLYFISTNSVTSARCREEVDFALELDVPVLTVYLQETQLSNRLLFRLANRQSIEAYRLSDADFRERLLQALSNAIHPEADSGTATDIGRSRTKRLLVLPMRNLTGDIEQEFFCDGLTEETINQLGRVYGRRLGVIARASAMLYKNIEKPIAEIRAELGVDYVLEGSVRLLNERLRISVSLVNAADQTQIWSNLYDRAAGNGFNVQDDVTLGVAGSLDLERVPETSTAGGNAAAREAFLKGRFHWYHHTAADYPIAIAYFEEAIHQDPNYAPAYVGLADTIATTAHRGQVPPWDVYPESKRLVNKALALNDLSPEAHDQKGRIAFAYDFDASTAEREFKRAIEVNPSYPDAHAIYAQLLAATGRRNEALVSVQRGLDLDPHNVFLQVNLGIQLAGVGRCEEAISLLQRIPKDVGFADEMLWGACFRAGRFTEALDHSIGYFGADAEVAAALKLPGDGLTATHYHDVMARTADVLVARSDERYVAPSQIARLYTHAERFIEAIQWLHKAIDIRDSWVVYSAVMAEYFKLWDVPEFQQVRERMDLLIKQP